MRLRTPLLAATLALVPALAAAQDAPPPLEGFDAYVTDAMDAWGAVGSIWSSVEDMSKWLRFPLGGCVTPDGTALLEPDTCERLFTLQTYDEIAAGREARLAYGPRTATLEHLHYDTFDAAWERARGGRSPATFTLDTRGVPTSFQALGRLFHREGGGG